MPPIYATLDGPSANGGISPYHGGLYRPGYGIWIGPCDCVCGPAGFRIWRGPDSDIQEHIVGVGLTPWPCGLNGLVTNPAWLAAFPERNYRSQITTVTFNGATGSQTLSFASILPHYVQSGTTYGAETGIMSCAGFPPGNIVGPFGYDGFSFLCQGSFGIVNSDFPSTLACIDLVVAACNSLKDTLPPPSGFDYWTFASAPQLLGRIGQDPAYNANNNFPAGVSMPGFPIYCAVENGTGNFADDILFLSFDLATYAQTENGTFPFNAITSYPAIRLALGHYTYSIRLGAKITYQDAMNEAGILSSNCFPAQLPNPTPSGPFGDVHVFVSLMQRFCRIQDGSIADCSSSASFSSTPPNYYGGKPIYGAGGPLVFAANGWWFSGIMVGVSSAQMNWATYNGQEVNEGTYQVSYINTDTGVPGNTYPNGVYMSGIPWAVETFFGDPSVPGVGVLVQQ